MEQDDRRVDGPAGGCHHEENVDILAATTKSLIAIGAAAALNYHARMRHLIPVALNNGILAEEVAAALGVAREIRKRAGESTDILGTALITDNEIPTNGGAHVTGCCRRATAPTTTTEPKRGPRARL